MRMIFEGHRCCEQGGRDRNSSASGAGSGSSTSRPLLGAGAVLISIPLALTGCSNAAGGSAKIISAPVLATYDVRGDDYSMQAALEGELTVAEGCVTINAATLPVFPNTATWDGTTLQWEGEQYEVGDTIKLGGGEPAIELELPATCDAFDAFLIQ